MLKPSKRQGEVLRYLAEFYARNDQLPPLDTVCAHFGWRSWNAAMDHVRALERKGYLERNDVGKYRFTSRARAYLTQHAGLARWFPTNGSAEPTNGIGIIPSAV
jgi:SOS-response transcriptional repressor LexA